MRGGYNILLIFLYRLLQRWYRNVIHMLMLRLTCQSNSDSLTRYALSLQERSPLPLFLQLYLCTGSISYELAHFSAVMIRFTLYSCCMYLQIYVEIERARLTKTLAHIKEQSGDVKEAASILQELQVSVNELICLVIVLFKLNVNINYEHF